MVGQSQSTVHFVAKATEFLCYFTDGVIKDIFEGLVSVKVTIVEAKKLSFLFCKTGITIM
jgi:hypothetical protein